MRVYQSWGRFPKVGHREVVRVHWRCDLLQLDRLGQSVLPYGQGRSYGDTCLNEDGALVDTSGLDRFIAFESSTGILRCEAGVTLARILELFVPRGWFLPVTPGTKHVSVGGAIAQDVHGKNHRRAGSFGCHVRRFEVLRSDGRRLVCSPTTNSGLFAATIGGLGLTGLILWAEIQLKPIVGPFMAVERVRFRRLAEFFEVAAESRDTHEYMVAWVDSSATGMQLGRGVLFRANHVHDAGGSAGRWRFRTPIDVPGWLLNAGTVRLWNGLYFNSHPSTRRPRCVHYESFLFPLDSVAAGNRLYGSRGMVQYQCLLPPGELEPALREILSRAACSGESASLAVLKVFGPIPSLGFLSFPRPGLTLALDFPYRGDSTLALLDQLDAVVRRTGGAANPAKDARMSSESFQAYFPRWREFSRYADPFFSSSFWRRVTDQPGAPSR